MTTSDRLTLLLAATLSVLVTPAVSEPQGWSRVGALNCRMGPSIGLVMGSLQKARCVFKPATTKTTEVYNGRMEQEGVDLGFIPGGKFSWMVLAETNSWSAKSLVGRYVGTTEGFILDGDNGGHALCSEADRSICLRPVRRGIEANENLAVGISTLQLQ